MEDLIAKLGIHWTQLLGQILNFAVLATVLTVFLYKPILKVLDERRESIRQSIAEADRIRKQREDLDRARTDAMAALDRETGALMERAKKEAETLHTEIVAAARREAETLIEKARRQTEAERRSVFEEAQRRLASIVVTLTQKLIEREFTPEDQKRVVAGIERDLPSIIA